MTLQDFKDQVARGKNGDNSSWQELTQNYVPFYIDELYDRAATLFAEHERKEAAPQWIKLAHDTFPKPGLTVIVCLKDRFVTTGYYSQGFWRADEERTLEVTHWQPLPNKPE